ncbi:MAG: HYR domain-containing protein, partial [Verrucomicrobia bacterium]|nr:HYR domain-containing protein [Verrucomicrobiota bacterium]
MNAIVPFPPTTPLSAPPRRSDSGQAAGDCELPPGCDSMRSSSRPRARGLGSSPDSSAVPPPEPAGAGGETERLTASGDSIQSRRQPLRLQLAWALAAASLYLPAAADPVGMPWTGQPGITATVETLSTRERQRTSDEARSARGKPMLRPDRRGLPQDPKATEAPHSGSGLKVSDLAPLSPQIVGPSFTGATLADCNAFPPDTMGTVGPTQFIVAVNGRIRSFNKTTGVADGVLNLSMDTFFNSVMTPVGGVIVGNFTSDPHIRYDRLSGRWFVVMIDVPYTNPSPLTTAANRVMIAVSSGATITGQSSFTFFQFRHDAVAPAGDTGNFADYPTLGIDNNALYIGDNVFNSAGTAYTGSSGFVVRKSSILGAGPPVVTAFRGLVPNGSSDGPYTPQGVDNYDPAATEGYFIGISSITKGRLVVRRVSTPGGTPTISANIPVTVPSTAAPITVPHLGNTGGTNGNLDPVDDRLFAAHLRNGRLWTAHNIQVRSTGVASSRGGRNGSRWYELQNLTGTPSVVQSGTVFDSATSNPKSFWIPTIMVSGQGHAAMGFSTAGANNRANAGTVGRLSGDTLGTMQTPVEYTASSTAYNPAGDPGGTGGRRWGDFSYTSLDPNDDMTMWTIQEFCDSADSYGVRVVKLSAPPPATPAACSPPSVAAGQAAVAVTVTGTRVAGSGFFDPGAGFANRLAGAVSGGVVVNSVTYTSPTSITLILNTTDATAGAHTVAVTNPDGQTLASGTGILNVIAVATVASLNLANPTPSNAGTTNWTLAFSSAVTGVAAGNFSLSGTAATGASVGTPATGDGGLTWNVPVTTGPSSGTLTLSLANATGQTPTVSTTLPFAGQSYAMDKTTQTPTFIAPATNAITGSPVGLAFSLPEAALGTSVQLLCSGAASRTLTLAATQETSGAHGFSFNPASPTLTTEIASITGGASIPDGTYTITLSYQDQLANPAAAVANTNIIIDTTAPAVTPPADLTAEATSAAGAVVNYPAATASDAVGVTSLTYSHASGTEFPLGITTVTVTAKDAANNTGTATFTVTVHDTTSPVVTPPADLTAEATSAAGAVVNYPAATASDAVGVISLTHSHASGTEFPPGITAVTVTAKDAANNTGTATFTVTVHDTTSPVVTPPADLTA